VTESVPGHLLKGRTTAAVLTVRARPAIRHLMQGRMDYVRVR